MKWILYKYTENAFFYNNFITELLFLILSIKNRKAFRLGRFSYMFNKSIYSYFFSCYITYSLL